MRYRCVLGAIVFGVVVQTASAAAYANFDSQNTFTVSISDPSVAIAKDLSNASGWYDNGIAPHTSGDGVNSSSVDEDYGFEPGMGFVYAQGQSSSAVSGTASQFLGDHYYVDFKNTSTVDQSFTLNVDVLQHLSASLGSKVNAYGGWQIISFINNSFTNQLGYFTNTLLADGSTANNYVGGFTGGATGNPGEFEGTSSVTFTLAPDQVAVVELWASGDTFAKAPVPEPFTMGLGIAGICLAIRRRVKAKAAG